MQNENPQKAKNKIQSKKKSKSINDRNLTKIKFRTTKYSIYAKSYNSNSKNNFYSHQRIDQNKNESNLKLYINNKYSLKNDPNTGLNMKNLKRNNLKRENFYYCKNNKEIKFNNENKENIFKGNYNMIHKISNNFFNEKKKTKSLEHKKNKLDKIFSGRIKQSNINRKLNVKNIKKKTELNRDVVLINKNELSKNNPLKQDNKNYDKISNNNEIYIEEEKNLNNYSKENEGNNKIEIKIEDNLNKNLDRIIRKISISDNINENIKTKEEHSNESNTLIEKEKPPKEEIINLKTNVEKENEEKSKQNIPILKLDTGSSSTDKSVSNSKADVTNSDYSETSYESKGLEIKGELLSKSKKTSFLNNLKKCLFDKDTNSNSNINSEEELKFKNCIKIEKRKTADFTNNYKINLKTNISFNESEIYQSKPDIKSATITQAGLNDNKKKTNQDSYLILENMFDQKLNIYGIFDGHGENGHLISNLVSNYLSYFFSHKINYNITKNNDTESSDSDSISIKSEDININDKLLKEVFSENNKFIENTINKLVEKSNECNFNLDFSGTTCCLLFILEDKIICSNIGDSQCVLFHCSNEERWTHEIISVIHKPDDPKESERIIEMGGEVHPYYDENGIYEGPSRVYVKNKTYPGLSLSRSIGDLIGEEVGIISEPNIVVKNIDSTCKYIVMGSDGLWDMIKPYDVSRIVNSFFNKGDPKGACKALLKRATKNWGKDGYDRDDITIILIFIGIPNNSH